MILIDALELPKDLVWADEFDFDAVAQEQTRTEGGQIIVEETALTAGQPITLRGSERTTWMTRTDLIALRALANAANTTYTLTLHDGRTFDVVFAKPAIESNPLIDYSHPLPDDQYVLTAVRLLTV